MSYNILCFLPQVVLVDAFKHPAAENLTYLHSQKSATRVKPVTHWVATDLATTRGRNLAAAAVDFLLNPDGEMEPAASRVAFLLISEGEATVLDAAVLSAQQVFAEDPKLLQLLTLLLKEQEELGVAVRVLSDKHQQKLQELAKEAGVAGADSWKLDAGQVRNCQRPAVVQSLCMCLCLLDGLLSLEPMPTDCNTLTGGLGLAPLLFLATFTNDGLTGSFLYWFCKMDSAADLTSLTV